VVYKSAGTGEWCRRVPEMPLERAAHREAFGTYKARKRYRKELEQVGIKVPGATKQSSKTLVNKVPLSSSLKHNDHMLLRLFKLQLVSDDEEEEKSATEDEAAEEGGDAHRRAQASLRELVSEMADQARTTLGHIQEVKERSAFWGNKSDEEFRFLESQAKLLMKEKGVQPYAEGQGSIKPRERIGEVE
jgi:hypothetical protein